MMATEEVKHTSPEADDQVSPVLFQGCSQQGLGHGQVQSDQGYKIVLRSSKRSEIIYP